jgi:hypothetical protein
MKMFVDLCTDVFLEGREKTWNTVFENLNKDPYWVAKTPVKEAVVAEGAEAAPAKGAKAAPPKRKPKPKKAKKKVGMNGRGELFDERPLEEKLWFHKTP